MTGPRRNEEAFFGYHTVRRPRGTPAAEKTRQAVEWLHANPGKSIQAAARKFGANAGSVGRLAKTEPIRNFRCPICNSILRAQNKGARKQVLNFLEWAKKTTNA